MFRVTTFEKEGLSNKLFLINEDDPDVPKLMLIRSGHLEMYAGAYGIGVGMALTLILADGLVDGFDCPTLDDPDRAQKIVEIMKAVPRLFDWSAVDRDQILADITLAADVAADVMNTWEAATADALSETPMTYEDHQRMVAERAASVAAGYQRRQEELLADDMVGQLVDDKRAAGALKNDPQNVASVQQHDDTMRVVW